MTAHSTYLTPPTADTGHLRATFQPVFDKIAPGSAEREQGRIFPRDQVRALIDAGFATLRIPAGRGGFGASLRQVFELLALLGAADANVSHIWRNHLAFVEDRLSAPTSPANDRWIERLLAGEFVGGGWTEADNGTFDNIKTRITRVGDHWEITGRKFYATGSLYADWLDVLGLGPDGAPLTALVRVDQPGPALAQRSHARLPQPADLQGAHHRRLAGQRRQPGHRHLRLRGEARRRGRSRSRRRSRSRSRGGGRPRERRRQRAGQLITPERARRSRTGGSLRRLGAGLRP